MKNISFASVVVVALVISGFTSLLVRITGTDSHKSEPKPHPSNKVECHGMEAYYNGLDLTNIDVCKGWSKEGVGLLLPKGGATNLDGVCAITCYDANGSPVQLPFK